MSRPPEANSVSTASGAAGDVGLGQHQNARSGALQSDVQPPVSAVGGPKLSAVVVHHNDTEHLLACVQALQRDGRIDEIVVVDNASDPDATAAVANCQGVQVVLSPVNLGFGGGANLGVAHTTGDFIVFLNPDTVPDPGCMAALAEHLTKHGGVVGPLVRTGPDGSPEYGYTIDRMLLPRALDHAGGPLYVSGCCLATTRCCFDTVGGFDNRYFLFKEDTEFCWQALRRGFSVAVLPGAGLAHVGGTAAAGGYRRAGRVETSSSRILLRERNSWAVLVSCAPGRRIPQLLALSMVRAAAFTGILILHGRPGDAVRVWLGLVWNVVHLRATLHRRWRAGVTPRGEREAWVRVERRFFLWDLARRGERLRFVDTEKAEVP